MQPHGVYKTKISASYNVTYVPDSTASDLMQIDRAGSNNRPPYKILGRCSCTVSTKRKFLPPITLLIYQIPRRQTVMQIDRAISYVSVMHWNGLKGLACLILEWKGWREMSCSSVLLKMLPSETQYWYFGTLPLCQDCIYTYCMSYCCKYWRKMSFVILFLFPRLSSAL